MWDIIKILAAIALLWVELTKLDGCEQRIKNGGGLRDEVARVWYGNQPLDGGSK